MKRLLLLALLLPLAVSAQTASKQNCYVNLSSNNQAAYSCTLPNVVVAGDTLVFWGVGPVASISDTQGNTWTKDVATTYLQFWHATAKGGTEAITANMSPNGGFNGGFAEYPPSSSVSVTTIASGTNATPASPSITTTGNGILLGFGTQWSNSYEAPLSTGTGFSVAKFAPVYLEDESVATGTFMASATYSEARNWFIGAAFLAPAQPSNIVTFTFPVQLTTCTKCDGTDDQGAAALGLFAGSKISISSGSSAVCSGVLNANAQMSCSAGIDIAPAIVPLSLTVTSGDGSTSYTDSQQILGILFMGRNVINVVALFDATNLQPRGLRVWSQ